MMDRVRRIGWPTAAALAAIVSWGALASATTIIIQPSPGTYESVIYDTTRGLSLSVHDEFLTHDTIMGTDSFKESDLLQFSLSTIPVGQVLTAELVLYHAENAVPANTIFNVYQNTSTWSSSTVTWSTLPSFQAAPLSSVSLAGAPGQSYSFNVTSAVNAWLAAPASNDGFTIERAGGGDPVAAFYSGLAGNPGADLPALVITFSPVPEPSSLLLLAAGAAGLLACARRGARSRMRGGPSPPRAPTMGA